MMIWLKYCARMILAEELRDLRYELALSKDSEDTYRKMLSNRKDESKAT